MENKTIYCTNCGSENNAESKFCSNCGTKLEKTQPAAYETPAEETAGVFSGEEAAPVYEKITDAEEQKPDPVPTYQEEIKINYDRDPMGFDTQPQPQYYSAQSYVEPEKLTGGKVGFAIAALCCGILSMLCCCFTLFSALLAIAAIVLGVITICFKYDGKGMAIAGIVTGAIMIVFTIMVLVLGSSSFFDDMIDAFYDFY